MQGKAKGPCSLARPGIRSKAESPCSVVHASRHTRTAANSKKCHGHGHGRWHGRMRSADPSQASSKGFNTHAESKASTGHATRTGPAPEPRSRSCVPRDAIPKPARSGPSAVTWRREKNPGPEAGRMSQKEKKGD
ncbi:hypothetical protein V8C34DRAFT_292239 [Trichoderma compactum]